MGLMEQIMDSSVVSALIGAFVTIGLFLGGWLIKALRERNADQASFSERMTALDKTLAEAMASLRAEVVSLRDDLKEWTRILVENQAKAQRKELKSWVRAEIKIAMADHREECMKPIESSYTRRSTGRPELFDSED